MEIRSSVSKFCRKFPMSVGKLQLTVPPTFYTHDAAGRDVYPLDTFPHMSKSFSTSNCHHAKGVGQSPVLTSARTHIFP